MKSFKAQKIYLVFMLILTVFMSSLPGYARAALTTVDLGAVATFAGFGGGAGMTNQGIFTVVNGDIGTTAVSSLVTGFHDTGAIVYTETPLNIGAVNGTVYTATAPPGSVPGVIAAAAELAAQTAFDNLSPAALPGGIDVSSLGGGAGELGSRTLYPGIYKSAPGSYSIQGGDLTLDGLGDPNAVWVFQMATSLTVGGPGAAFPQSVILVNGAQAKNVFWQVGSAATINAAGGGTMAGTIIAYSGAAFSTADNVDVVTLNGRALALHASVTLVNTVINVPALHQAVGKAAMITPANATTLAGVSQAFTWNDVGANLYQIWVGTSPGTFNIGAFPSAGTTATATTATGLSVNGTTLYVRLWSLNGATWSFNDYTYKAAGTQSAAAMSSPATGSALAGASQTFTWTNAAANLYQVWVGTSPGAFDIGAYPSAGTTATTTAATGLPVNGTTLYVRLWSKFGSTWSSNDYTYTASGTPSAATMATPANGATLAGLSAAGASVPFAWTNVGAILYQIWVGRSLGTFDIGAFPAGGTTLTTATATGLPAFTAGTPIHVRLWSKFGTTWRSNDYTYASGL